jgi:hypothetical protein
MVFFGMLVPHSLIHSHAHCIRTIRPDSALTHQVVRILPSEIKYSTLLCILPPFFPPVLLAACSTPQPLHLIGPLNLGFAQLLVVLSLFVVIVW